MASHNGRSPYSPSAPPVPDPEEPQLAHPYDPYSPLPPPPPPNRLLQHNPPPNYPYSYAQNQPQTTQNSSYGAGPSHGYYPTHNPFPPGTHPDVIRSFQMVDRDQSGYIDEKELQEALSSGYQRFSIQTVRLLMFLFRNPSDSSSRIGPKEFSELWSCLGQWRGIFERFDRDRSGKIEASELRDALYSLGYAVPPKVLEVLVSRYDDGSGRRNELNFDSFVECGMIVKGLTEKFKEKDPRYTGSARLTYDEFMRMVLPFLVS